MSQKIDGVTVEISNAFLESVDGITERLSPLIETLATQLGVASEFVFETLMKQAFVSGITDCIIYILVGCMIIYSMKQWKIHTTSVGEESEVASIKATIFSMMGGIGIVYFFTTIGMTITCFINPQFWALNYIIDRL